MVKLGQIMVDPRASTGGRWFTFEENFRLLIARGNNPLAEKYRRQLLREAVEGRAKPILQPGEAEEINKKVMAKHVLLGWEGLDDDDGKPLSFSPEKALEFFRDERFVDLYNFVLVVSHDRDNFRAQRIEDAAGNSQSSSDGNSNGARSSDSSSEEPPRDDQSDLGSNDQS